MKKILLTVIVAMLLIACKEKTEMPNETSSEEKTAVKDSVAENKTEITFEDKCGDIYKVKYKENPKAEIFINDISVHQFDSLPYTKTVNPTKSNAKQLIAIYKKQNK